ncbi:MAG: hypothetical protein NVS4B8_10320 [Herpetosiphon sp.]
MLYKNLGIMAPKQWQIALRKEVEHPLIAVLIGSITIAVVLVFFFALPRSRTEYITLFATLIIFLCLLAASATPFVSPVRSADSQSSGTLALQKTGSLTQTLTASTAMVASATSIDVISPTRQALMLTPDKIQILTASPTMPSVMTPTGAATFSQTTSTALARTSTALATASPTATITRTSARLRVDVHVVPTAERGSWLEVRSDGRPVFNQLLGPGQSVSWIAQDSLTINIGNTSAITLAVNEQKCAGFPGGVNGQRRTITITAVTCP